jgi:hypothetical protein
VAREANREEGEKRREEKRMGRVLVKWSLYSSLIIPAMAVFVYACWLLVVNHLMPKKYKKRALHSSAHEYWLSNQFNAISKTLKRTWII